MRSPSMWYRTKCLQQCVCVSACVCVRTPWGQSWKIEAKSNVCRGFLRFPPVGPTTTLSSTCLSLPQSWPLWALGVLMGSCSGSQSDIPGPPRAHFYGEKIELLFSGELASCPGQKIHHTSPKGHAKPMPVPAHGPVAPRMLIPIGDPTDRPWLEASHKHWARAGLYPDLGAWASVLFESSSW